MTWKEAREFMDKDAESYIQAFKQMRQLETDFNPSQGLVALMRQYGERAGIPQEQDDDEVISSK